MLTLTLIAKLIIVNFALKILIENSLDGYKIKGSKIREIVPRKVTKIYPYYKLLSELLFFNWIVFFIFSL